MRVDVFSAKPHDEVFLNAAAKGKDIEFCFHAAKLDEKHVYLAEGAEAVCVFVNDTVNAAVLTKLVEYKIGLIALRCAGFNNVDLQEAHALGIKVARVPAYSPYAVAEHALALMLTLNRKTHRAYNRVREGNFALDGLMGFDMHAKTVGIVGTGLIGLTLAKILKGLGCEVLGYDPYPSAEGQRLGIVYVAFEALLQQSDIISLQCPLTLETRHLIDADALSRTKPGVMLINTSRGAVIDTQAVIQALKTGHIGALGLDVYEEEANIFFEDLSRLYIPDDQLARLLTFPNVLITGHQGFFTQEALTGIAQTTVANICAYHSTGEPMHVVPQ